MLTYDDVMARLATEGYENCHGDGFNQIIVNNRGEIDFWMFEDQPTRVEINDRHNRTGLDINYHTDIDSLFIHLATIWPKKEPK